MRPRLLAAAAVAALTLVMPTAAHAAPPAPFGHACAPRDGALFCPTAIDAERVPSFDAVPLDVDVWLPAAGDGPFPTIAMLHGFGQDKTAFQDAARQPTYNAAYFARAGFAVVVPSARGFGRSCGLPDSRTLPGCARGWLHLADQRYEARDVQHLLGLLVDQGVARAAGLGVTGVSYGGGTSLELAFLRDRIRLPSGAYAPWTSPAGRALALAAAYPRWPWSDLSDALVPNGRSGITTYASPIGVPLKSYVDALFGLAGAAGFVAPPGADPAADLVAAKARLDRGEPYDAVVRAFLDEIHRFHGATGIVAGRVAPLLIQSGWTDDLFPVPQALRVYDLLRRRAPGAPVALQLGDLGHARASNHPADARAMEGQALRFFLRRLGAPGGADPQPGAVLAYLSRCPKSAARGGGPLRAASFDRLARGTLRFGRRGAAGTVTSSGGDASLSSVLNPLAGGSLKWCKPVEVSPATGTVVASARAGGVTLAGRTDVRARVRVRGSDALLVARLWDVDPRRRTQRLIDRAVVRLRSASSVRFALNGNAWRFPAGHRARVELLGRDSPTWRPANGTFSVRVADLRIAMPTRERRPAAR
jgi:dienelactone hydrolase